MMITHDYRLNLYSYHAYINQKRFDPEDREELKAASKRADYSRNAILKEIPKAIDAIELEFKGILGVEEKK